MIKLICRSALVLVLLMGSVLPSVSQAAYLGMPQRLTSMSGVQTYDTTPTFTWDMATNATWYDAAVDNGAYHSLGEVFSFTTSTLTHGWHTVAIRARNEFNEASTPALLKFEVLSEGPVVSAPSYYNLTEDVKTWFTVSTSAGAAWCDFHVNGVNVGDMVSISNAHFTFGYTFADSGTYTVWAHCTNRSGVGTVGAKRTVTVSERTSSSNDDEGDLVVPAVTPSSATEDMTVTIKVRPESDVAVYWCDLYVNGKNVGDMERVSSSLFEQDYVFTNSGSYTVYAYCTDADGESVKGSSRTITVSRSSSISEGQLIKTADNSAVYYYGTDGKRHAFPTESVFYSWFNDFSDVVTVSSSFMSSLTIGQNVTYRPGSVLVSFESGDDVYAVSEGGVLHRYLSESLIRGDYGSNWLNDVEIVADVFFGNYDIGSVIDSSGDYDPDSAWNSVSSLDDNF